MSSIVSFRWHVPRGCCWLAVLPSTHLTFAEDEADPLHSLFSAVHNAALLIRMIRGWQRPKIERWQRLGNGFEGCYCHTGLYHPMLNCCFYSSNMASTWLFLYFFFLLLLSLFCWELHVCSRGMASCTVACSTTLLFSIPHQFFTLII